MKIEKNLFRGIGCKWGERHAYLEKKRGLIVYGMDITLMI
jgi:hypothetical protein